LILVDSSVWIEFFRAKASPQTARLESLLGTHPIAIGDLMLVEVLRGFATDYDFHRTGGLWGVLPGGKLCGPDRAGKAARNYRSLRARGTTIRGTIDTVIATRCIEDNLPLLYSDRDFDPFVQHLGLRSALDS